MRGGAEFARWPVVFAIAATSGAADADDPAPSATAATVAPSTVPVSATGATGATTTSAATAPANARSLTEHTVDRSGPVVLGGLSTDSDVSTFRLDVIVPFRLSGAQQFRVGMMAAYGHNSGAFPSAGIDVDAYGLSVGANAYYDWRLPVSTSGGDFVVSVEGGPIVGTAWVKIDQPFMPGTFQRLTALALRGAGALQYRWHSGLVVSLQPIGIDIPLTTPKVPANTMLTVTSKVAWEGAFLCGYQFR